MPTGTTATTVTTLRGYVVLDQGSQCVLFATSDVPLQWHPSEPATLHYLDGSSEPVTVHTTARPKKVRAGQEFAVSVDRAGDPISDADVLYIALLNRGAPVEVWERDAAEALAKQAARKRKATAKKPR
ncbi:hypothetical protein [Nannocystis pusilla]|uniref:hypothetical protein n=1 Tax=Nannocystis pusilla TaxID=889268 RepID=UPI003BF3EF9E